MNRKNLTAAVLAGLAGAAGIAGTAQAVNMNPDGLGQVLIYPYYTVNDGNDTLLSVVNTSDDAKAVKVRFKEGYNSREVLDFNLYMSAYDVWAAAIVLADEIPTLLIPDSSCTVPYLYEQDSDDDGVGEQTFLPYDYSGDNNDGGPDDGACADNFGNVTCAIPRANEGYFEMIEMGTLLGDSADNATHAIDKDGVQAPADCDALVEAWTTNPDGYWIDDGKSKNGSENAIDIGRNSGGLFGGAAIINVENGTMYSYDAKAIQGFDKSTDGSLHARPGGIFPNLNSGSENDATVFFGAPIDKAITLHYNQNRTVDALSAVMMKENVMNEYNIEAGIHAASEWILTFATKNWYVDEYKLDVPNDKLYIPDETDVEGCNGWEPGDDYAAWNGPGNTKDQGWTTCDYIKIDPPDGPIPPFTSLFDGEACEPFDITIWDREENSGEGPNNSGPPIVSPPPPSDSPDDVDGELCYEVNVLRFGNDGEYASVFGTDSDLLVKVDTGAVAYDNGTKFKPRVNGWANINLFTSKKATLCEAGTLNKANGKFVCEHYVSPKRWPGLVGLPVLGFWAEQFENGFLEDNPGVLANYGGLFQHKGNIRRRNVCIGTGSQGCNNRD
jgi:hypothetical protein